MGILNHLQSSTTILRARLELWLKFPGSTFWLAPGSLAMFLVALAFLVAPIEENWASLLGAISNPATEDLPQ